MSPLPTDPAEFAADERVAFANDGKAIATTENGDEFEWDARLGRWVAALDDALVEQHRRAYGGSDSPPASDGKLEHGSPGRGGNGSTTESNNDLDRNTNRPNASKKRSRPDHSASGPPPAKKPKQNTAVYVIGLPPDATVDQVHALFSRKCGLIAEEIDSGRPRIKLYTNPDGAAKGDALVVFYKPQSVEMAVMLLDDSEFESTTTREDGKSWRICVQPADLSYKKTQYVDDEAGSYPVGGDNKSSGCGDPTAVRQGDHNSKDSTAHDPAARPDKPRRTAAEKLRVQKKSQKLDAKLADWDEDQDHPLAALVPKPTKSSRWDRVVILSHMFTADELAADRHAIDDIEDDVRDECEKIGPVSNVIVFDQEPDGVISVKFDDVADALACIDAMSGRFFGGRRVEATQATGRERYRRSKLGEDNSLH